MTADLARLRESYPAYSIWQAGKAWWATRIKQSEGLDATVWADTLDGLADRLADQESAAERIARGWPR